MAQHSTIDSVLHSDKWRIFGLCATCICVTILFYAVIKVDEISSFIVKMVMEYTWWDVQMWRTFKPFFSEFLVKLMFCKKQLHAFIIKR